MLLHSFSSAITGAKLDASQAEMSDSGTNLLAHSFVNKIVYLKYKIKQLQLSDFAFTSPKTPVCHISQKRKSPLCAVLLIHALINTNKGNSLLSLTDQLTTYSLYLLCDS